MDAFKRRFSSSRSGFAMPSTKNHLVRSKFETQFRDVNFNENGRTEDLRMYDVRVARNGSLCGDCSIKDLDREIWRGKGAPSGDCRRGWITGVEEFLGWEVWRSDIRVLKVLDSV